ncbi:MAG: hypothetical protein ACYTCU_06150 [Planctomycetota bacterium]
MKRPSPPPPPKGLPLRRWILPVIAVMLVISLFRDGGFDREDLVADFEAGRVEDALSRLAATNGVGLAPNISRLDWWSKETRAPAVSKLLATPESDLLESPEYPTFIAPLDSYREEPAAAVLREAHGAPLVFELTHIGLDLLAMQAAVPPGTTRVEFDVGLLPGEDYQIALRETGPVGPDGTLNTAILALARFRWAPDEEAQQIGLAMATAHDLAVPHHEGSALLSAIVALGYGYTAEAIDRLAELETAPGYEQIARELHALALERQGLDWSARQLLLR